MDEQRLDYHFRLVREELSALSKDEVIQLDKELMQMWKTRSGALSRFYAGLWCIAGVELENRQRKEGQFDEHRSGV